MSGARFASRVRAASLCAALLALAAPASADTPSIWARARWPEVARRAELVSASPPAWAAEDPPKTAEGLQLKYELLHTRRVRRQLDKQQIEMGSEASLAGAALLLEEAGVRASDDRFARLHLAEVYGLLGKPAKAAALLEAILREGPQPMLRARAHFELAIAYAHLGRIADEIGEYGEALRDQPVPRERALLLANRAEGYMLLGDITASVQGYRDALALLSTDGLSSRIGPTTLWGLAVALDRSGDLDASLEAVRLARSYDAQDEQLNGDDWFYLPDYDRYWYGALGHWMVARKTDMGSVRAAAYASAVAAWEDYVGRAANDDKWVAVARVRLEQCKKESADFLRREKARMAEESRQGGKKADPTGRAPSPPRPTDP